MNMRRHLEIKQKTIKDLRNKQVEAIQNQGHAEIYSNGKDNLLISKQKEICNKLADEKLEEVTVLVENFHLGYFEYR